MRIIIVVVTHSLAQADAACIEVGSPLAQLEELLFDAQRFMPAGSGRGDWLHARDLVSQAHEQLSLVLRELKNRAA